MLLYFLDSTSSHARKMLNNIESVDMVLLLIYSMHAVQGDICLCFAEFSVYVRPKLIQIIVILSVRLDALKGAFLNSFR